MSVDPSRSMAHSETALAQTVSTTRKADRAQRRQPRGVLTPAGLVALGVLAVVGCAVSLYVTRRGPLVLPDSAAYLSAAHNLVTGKGLTTAFNPATSLYHPTQAALVYGRVPLAQYGPLYPMILALVHYLGFSDNNCVRVVGLGTLVAFIVLLGMLAARFLDRRLTLVALLVPVCVAAPGWPLLGHWVNPLALSTFALSDLLFYALVLASLLAVDAWLRVPTRGRLTVVILFIVAAVLTRYAGVSVAAAAACAALSEMGWDRRLRRAGALVLIGSGFAAFIGWDLINGAAFGATSPRALVFHPHGHLAQVMLHVAGPWFFPTSWPSGARSWGAVVIVTATMFVSLGGPARRWVVKESPVAVQAPLRLWRIGAFFVICYTAMLVVTRTWLDASLAIDNRVLGPLQTVLYLLIASIIYWAVRSRVQALRPRRWAIGAVVATALLVWAPNLASLSSELGQVASATPVGADIRAIPPSRFVITNDSAGFYLHDGHASILLPFRWFYTTDEVNRDFNRDIREVGRLVRQHHGIVVWSPILSPGVPSVTDLEEGAHLVITARLAHGVVILAAPPR
ncbi:MAG TPA: hypothetical protein VIX85_14955 [Acidimicrobiales bacterium]